MEPDTTNVEAEQSLVQLQKRVLNQETVEPEEYFRVVEELRKSREASAQKQSKSSGGGSKKTSSQNTQMSQEEAKRKGEEILDQLI